jgi:hypothetical protein
MGDMFVIGKNFMTSDQIKEFRNLVGKFYEAGDLDRGDKPLKFGDYEIEAGETYINEDNKYFYGDICSEHYPIMVDFMKRHKLTTKYSVSG